MPNSRFPTFWMPKSRNPPHVPISNATYWDQPYIANGDPRFQFLVHTRFVISPGDEEYSLTRSGIIFVTGDIGIDGLKNKIWNLLHSNKFTRDEIPWDDDLVDILELDVRVKWMPEAQNQRVPDLTLETDAEVRSAIEFMANRGSKDHFSVTCYLTLRENEGDRGRQSW